MSDTAGLQHQTNLADPIAASLIELLASWTVLQTEHVTDSSLSAIGTGHSVFAGEVRVGIDGEGHRHLLVPVRPGEVVPVSLSGSSVQIRKIMDGDTTYLSIICLAARLNEVFAQFCRELLTELNGVQAVGAAVAKQYQKWRSLFDDTGPDRSSSEAVLGMIGELEILLRILEHGGVSDLSWWTGPSKQVHDFRSPSWAIEAKASLLRNGKFATIHGVDQLDVPEGVQELYLWHLRFEANPSGVNVAGMISRVLDQGADATALAKCLRKAAITVEDQSTGSLRKYSLREMNVYRVSDPQFPKIVHESFRSAQLPVGTAKLVYEIDLSTNTPSPIGPDEVRAVLTNMAMDTISTDTS